MDIYTEICNLRRQGRRSALATIVNVRGSIPSTAAAKMLVRDDGSILGTIGGGCVENDVCKGAMEVMKDEKPRSFNFDLNQHPDDDTGLVCGGSQVLMLWWLMIERLSPTASDFLTRSMFSLATWT